MKNVIVMFVSLLVVVLLTSCGSTPEQTCQSLIKENLLSRMNDPKSYESVSFGKLDTCWEFTKCPTSLEDSSTFYYQKANRLLDEVEIMNYSLSKSIKLCKLADQYTLKSIKFSEEQKKLTESFVSERSTPTSLIMEHTCRGKNKFGGVILKSQYYLINFEMTKVISVL